MKTTNQEKELFLIENGYVDETRMIALYSDEYDALSENEKQEYILVKSSSKGDYDVRYYIKKSDFPNLTDNDFQQIAVLEKDRKLRRIEEHLKTIKYCALILAGVTILSIIASIIISILYVYEFIK